MFRREIFAICDYAVTVTVILMCITVTGLEELEQSQRLNLRETYLPMSKTTNTDICTSYPDHIPLTLRVYLLGG